MQPCAAPEQIKIAGTSPLHVSWMQLLSVKFDHQIQCCWFAAGMGVPNDAACAEILRCAGHTEALRFYDNGDSPFAGYHRSFPTIVDETEYRLLSLHSQDAKRVAARESDRLRMRSYERLIRYTIL
jgi:hypothetical protein